MIWKLKGGIIDENRYLSQKDCVNYARSLHADEDEKDFQPIKHITLSFLIVRNDMDLIPKHLLYL